MEILSGRSRKQIIGANIDIFRRLKYWLEKSESRFPERHLT